MADIKIKVIKWKHKIIKKLIPKQIQV